jgi:hypothetical protein
MSTSVDSKILDRIAKLLALSGNNPSANEAAAAAGKAAELMQEYRLTMADVSRSQQGKDVSAVEADHVFFQIDTAQEWVRVLAQVVAMGMDGKTVWTKNHGSKKVRVYDNDPSSKWYGKMVNTDQDNPHFRPGGIHFFGPVGTPEIMVEIFRYLYHQTVMLIPKAAAEAKRTSIGRKFHGKTFRASYTQGICTEVNIRMGEAKARANAKFSTETVNALVLHKDALDRKISDVLGKVSKGGKGSAIKDADAYYRGRADGRNLDLGGPKVARKEPARLGS